uniref:Uncharacterized protein n=1 Tax=Rhizophora mucronata TaxID=61149 RepID=A0A2P2MEL4_RHIMU
MMIFLLKVFPQFNYKILQ